MKKYFVLISYFILLIFSASMLYSAVVDLSNIPKNYGVTNVGKDFWMTFHPNYLSGTNSIRIYVSSNVETRVTVEIIGRGFMQSKTTIPNDIIEFNLSTGIAQPYTETNNAPPPAETIYDGAAIHVYSDDNIICYGISKATGTTDGFVALPTNVLGKDYVVASWADTFDNKSSFGPSYTSIVAPFDNTKVTITIGGTASTQTKGGLKLGTTNSWTLYRGDVIMIPTSGRLSDLSGTVISATKPVAVFSGNYCACVPEDETGCDYMIEQELPTYSWGKLYHLTPIEGKKAYSYIKVFPKTGGTNISRNGAVIASINTADGRENTGWIKMRADVGTSIKPVVISGDKPIYVVQYNTSRSDDNTNIDPFQMNLTPVEQYQNEITFNTPGTKATRGFTKNYMNIIYQSSDENSIPDDLELGQLIGNTFTWAKFASMSPTPGKAMAIVNNGIKYIVKNWLVPEDGVYSIRAANPIHAYLTGYTSNDCYGFAATAMLKNFEKVDSMAPVPNWTHQCDGSIDDGVVKDYPDNNTRSNLSVVSLNNNQSYNYNFKYADFISGELGRTTWTAFVNDLSKDARAVITFADREGNDTTIVVDYYVYKLNVRPNFIDFGTLKPGDSVIKDVWLINESSSIQRIITLGGLKLNNKGFTLLTDHLQEFQFPVSIPPMDSIRCKIKFMSDKDGTYSDSLGIGDTCFFKNFAQTQAFVGSPQINVADCYFNDTYVGKTSTIQASLSNKGMNELVVTGYSVPNENVFLTQIQEMSETNPLKLTPGQLLTFSVSFKPDTNILYQDSIVFYSNALSTDNICYLNGTGIIKPLDVSEFIQDNNILLFPNPVDNTLNIDLGNSQLNVLKIKVFDIYGNTVLDRVTGFDRKYCFNTVGLPQGVYFTQIISNKGIITRSFNIVR